MHDHRACAHGGRVGHHDGAVRRERTNRSVVAADQFIEGDQHIDRAGCRLVRRQRRHLREAEVADDRPGLLREACLVEAAHVQPAQHGGGADDLADGDHAGTADAGEPDGALEAAARVEPGGRIGEAGRGGARCGGGVFASRGPRVDAHGHEGGAVALRARVVEVARTLVDAGLATEWCLHRLHGETVALLATIATALAHSLVDHHPELRCADLPALAVAAFLGSAALIVDQHGAAVDCREHLLGFDQPTSTPHLHTDRQLDRAVALQLVGGDDHPLDALGEQHLAQLRHVELTERVLPAGHRHCAVVEDLVGDVGAVGDGSADGCHPAVEERAVTEVLEQVVVTDERRHAEPLGTLVAHRSEADDVPGLLWLQEHHHAVAADAGADESAIGHLGGRVVRAPCTEVRRTGDRQWDQLPWRGRRRRQPLGKAMGQQAPQLWSDRVGLQRARHREQRPVVGGALADDDRRIGPAVERVLDDPLEVLCLLLDDDHLRQAVGELAHLRGVERHGHCQLEHPDARGAQIVGGPQAQ